MNYFAHGAPFVDRPYFTAGTAIPDWLGVVDRTIRVPPRRIQEWAGAADQVVAQLAQGILQHHEDDATFHVSLEFNRACLGFTDRIRSLDGFFNEHVASLLAHITVELLLDASLIERYPHLLDRYYDAIGRIDAHQVAQAIETMVGKHPASLPKMIGIFHRERFLMDYRSDDALHYRLQQVMTRAGLGAVPDGFRTLLPWMRQVVDEKRDGMVDPMRYSG